MKPYQRKLCVALLIFSVVSGQDLVPTEAVGPTIEEIELTAEEVSALPSVAPPPATRQQLKPKKDTVLTLQKDPATGVYMQTDLLGIKLVRDKRVTISTDHFAYYKDKLAKEQRGVEFYGLPFMPEQEELRSTHTCSSFGMSA